MTTAIQKSSGNDIKAFLESKRDAIAEVLPRHLTPERVIKVALIAYNKTPKLQQCSKSSLFMAIVQASEVGLEPGGALGHAYLVPYGQQCQLIIGYRGLIDLARRSGQIASIEAHVVRENDKFRCRFGMEPVLEHEPCWKGDPGEIVCVYAVAVLKDGSKQLDVMTKAEVDAIRSRSRSSQNGPWVTDYSEMARKTVVRRLCKYLPLSVEMARAFDIDAENDPIDITPTDAQPAVSRTESLKARLLADEEAEESQVIDIESAQAEAAEA